MNLNRREVLTKVSSAEKVFKGSRYYPIVESALVAFTSGGKGLKEAQNLLNTLPTGKQLLEQLLEKLKGKSVHKTLSRIVQGKTKNKFENLKGWLSLGTHSAIECEQGNTEFRAVLFEIYEKLGKLLFTE